MTFLQVEDVHKVYSTRFGGGSVQALQGVSFQVEKGSFTAIMGESGSGKTTLLNILAALDQPSRGRVLLRGLDIGTVPERKLASFRRRNLGFLFQSCDLLDQFNIGDNILLPLILNGEKPGVMQLRLREIAERLELSALLKQYPYEVSGGQKQRAAAARALITNPELLLADEPTGALDSRSTRRLMELLELSNRMGQTIIMVTHSVEAASYARRMLLIRDGLLREDLELSDPALDRAARYQRISLSVSRLAQEREQQSREAQEVSGS